MNFSTFEGILRAQGPLLKISGDIIATFKGEILSVFKKIIDREIPADILYEDELCIVFKDIAPCSPFHVLVVPKKEIISLDHINPEDQSLMGHLMLTANKVAKENGLSDNGYRVITNIGEWGGQTVPHLHFHVIGGKPLGSAMA